MKSNVTVFAEFFNEEDRIDSFLKNFSWADEVVIFDKMSTDATGRIARASGASVVEVPFTSGSENIVENISKRESEEWILYPTASTFIHPTLVAEIIRLTSDTEFPYDVIGMPYGIYCFGIRSINSPWHEPHKYTLIRRSVLKLSTRLHHEITFDSERIYVMPQLGSDEILYHCTNIDIDDFYSRTQRYTRYEANYVDSIGPNITMRSAFFSIIKAIGIVTLKKRSFTLGWDGVGLSLAYVSYFITRFLYIWDRQRVNGRVVYPDLRKSIGSEWDRIAAEKLSASKSSSQTDAIKLDD
tara:strand:+ start:369 stop:1262 length:894 start_codon:yes stop_codon:yes gene_type:complete